MIWFGKRFNHSRYSVNRHGRVKWGISEDHFYRYNENGHSDFKNTAYVSK